MSADLPVDGDRLRQDIERTAEFGAVESDDGRGRTALPADEANGQARDYLVDQLEAAGLDIRIDAVGNIAGRWTPPSADSDAAAVAAGSHLDSVPRGGIFDGPLGVFAALEGVRAIQESTLEPTRPIEVVCFTGEEGTRFADGVLGSTVATGKRSVGEMLTMTDGTVTLENGASKMSDTTGPTASMQASGTRGSNSTSSRRRASETLVFRLASSPTSPVPHAATLPSRGNPTTPARRPCPNGETRSRPRVNSFSLSRAVQVIWLPRVLALLSVPWAISASIRTRSMSSLAGYRSESTSGRPIDPRSRLSSIRFETRWPISKPRGTCRPRSIVRTTSHQPHFRNAVGGRSQTPPTTKASRRLPCTPVRATTPCKSPTSPTPHFSLSPPRTAIHTPRRSALTGTTAPPQRVSLLTRLHDSHRPTINDH